MADRYRPFEDVDFAPVMKMPEKPEVLDLRNGLDAKYIQQAKWAIGRYNEKRRHMYIAEQYEGRRNIHVGIDFWAPSGQNIFSFYDGTIVYFRDNNQKGNYGPTIVTQHTIKGEKLYALWGHLSRESLHFHKRGDMISKGQKLAEVGDETENGNWPPHLHFQLSWNDPGEADMPGVVSQENHKEALQTYPDPRIVLGDLY